MIQKITMIKCDRCGEVDYYPSIEKAYSYFSKHGWHRIGKNHYCVKCYFEVKKDENNS